MEMAGEQRISASRQRVWEALNDPEILRASIPGCQSLDNDGDRYNAVAEVKIGPIGARFKGTVALSDLDPPNGYTITGQGNGGVAGNARGGARVRLSDDAGGGTIVSYNVDAEVGGRMAQLGGPIIDATAKQLAGKFFSRFGEIVGGEPVAAPAAASVAAEAVAAPIASPPAYAASAPLPAETVAFPWVWVIALALAILTGFLIGRSAAMDGWIIIAFLLAAAAAWAGFDAGRRQGGQP
jgi:carbon monoxide dehydrogenase subunit G